METRCIAHSFVGFAHEVTPIQKVFHKECDGALANADVLEFLSILQKALIEDLTKGASALCRNRKSRDVIAEDLLCYLDIQWKVDPLLLSDKYYRVAETTEKIDFPCHTKPLPRQRSTRRCSNTMETTPKVKKMSARELKEAHKRTLDICRFVLFKTPLPPLKNKPESELKNERQPSIEMSCHGSLVGNFENKDKQEVYGVHGVSRPSPVAPTYKSNSKVEKRTSICERCIKVLPSKEKTEPEFKVPRPYPESLTIRMPEMKQDVSVPGAVPVQFPEAPTYKPKSKVEEKTSTCDRSIKVFPLKKKTKPKLKVAKQPSIKMSLHGSLIDFFANEHEEEVYSIDDVSEPSPVAPTYKSNSKVEKKTSICERSIKVLSSKLKTEPEFNVHQPYPDSLTIRMHGMKQDAAVPDAVPVQFPEAPTYKPKSKVEEKMSTCDRSMKVFLLKKQTEPELKMAKQPSIERPRPEALFAKLSRIECKQEVPGVDAVLKRSPEAPICKPKSKVHQNTPSCEHSTKVFPFKEKTELEFKVEKQPSIEMPCPGTQVLKIPGTTGKQEVPIVKCASFETPEDERKYSIKVLRPDTQVPKIRGKKRKREISDIDGVPVETPEAARKRLAVILLRIAGKY